MFIQSFIWNPLQSRQVVSAGVIMLPNLVFPVDHF